MKINPYLVINKKVRPSMFTISALYLVTGGGNGLQKQ